MPRPFPWLSRLSNIRRSVSNSQRSHYTRRDIELLFGISRSAAGRLLDLVATDGVGADHLIHLVSRDRLSSFLEAVSASEDIPALCATIRADRGHLSRVKARYLCLRDDVEVPLASLSGYGIRLEPGHLEISFDGMEDLFRRLVVLAVAAKDDPLGCEEACEGPREKESAEARDARYIRGEIERMKREQEGASAVASMAEIGATPGD